MPRDGSSIYHVPPGTQGVPDTTISSTVYNAFLGDLEGDLNAPRPIVAGGTGASDAHSAMIALSGEIAKQGPITNFDTFPFANGSWFSNGGATSAPNGNAFVGVYYEHATNPAYATISAIELIGSGTPARFSRQKQGGVWSAWQQQAGNTADLDAAYVNVSGDTMTGALHVTDATPSSSPTTGALTVVGGVGIGGNEWVGGSSTIEGTLTVWSTFGAYNFNVQLGTITSTTPSTSPTTGALTVAGGVGIGKNLAIADDIGGSALCIGTFGHKIGRDGVVTGGLFIGGGQANVEIDAGNPLKVKNALASSSPSTGALTVAGGAGIAGALWVGGGVGCAQSPTTGSYFFGTSGTKYLQYDGTNFNFAGGSVYVPVPSANMGITVGRGGNYTYSNSNAAGVSLLQDSSYFESTGSQNNTVMHVNRISSNGPVVVFDQTSTIVGTISVTTTATAYNTSSDLRLKEDLKSFDAGNIIDKTEVYDFKWKNIDERSYGVIAQQAKEIYPTAVAYDEHNDWWGIDYSKYVPVLLQELKALRARVAQLEGQGKTVKQASRKGN